MPRFAEPVPAPAARKAAAPAAARPQPRRAPPASAAAIRQVAQLRAASAAAKAGTASEPSRRDGLPARLRSGLEALSGLFMGDVRVHRNSPEPAKLGALAYTQGSDIHLGPGQEQHLPHEAWHAVQQKQGRVHATTQMKGAAINDDKGLETEADRQGSSLSALAGSALAGEGAPCQRSPRTSAAGRSEVLQLQKGAAGGGAKSKGDSEVSLTVGTGLTGKFDQPVPIPSFGPFDIKAGFRGETTVKHEKIKALTEAEKKTGSAAIGVELNTQLRKVVLYLAKDWQAVQFEAMKNPFNPTGYVSSDVGAFSIKTSMSFVPWEIESTIQPKKNIAVKLPSGVVLSTSVSYYLSASLRQMPQQQPGLSWKPDWRFEVSKFVQVAAVVALIVWAIIETVIAIILLLLPKP